MTLENLIVKSGQLNNRWEGLGDVAEALSRAAMTAMIYYLPVN